MEISKRSLGLDTATQEKPRKTSGHRSDMIVWIDRLAVLPFLAIELKTPTTPINDPVFFGDALAKGRYWKSKYFALWNMKDFELYETPPASRTPTPADVVKKSSRPLALTRVDDWLKTSFKKDLHEQAVEIMDAAVNHNISGLSNHRAIDPDIFVTRLTEDIGQLRTIFYRDLKKASATDRKLRKKLREIATEQGFEGFVDDIDYAIAGQIGYRYIGQILFYFALRRKIPALRELKIGTQDVLPAALKPFFDDVRRYDYEALFKPEAIEALVPIAHQGQAIIRRLIAQLAVYDWANRRRARLDLRASDPARAANPSWSILYTAAGCRSPRGEHNRWCPPVCIRPRMRKWHFPNECVQLSSVCGKSLSQGAVVDHLGFRCQPVRCRARCDQSLSAGHG